MEFTALRDDNQAAADDFYATVGNVVFLPCATEAKVANAPRRGAYPKGVASLARKRRECSLGGRLLKANEAVRALEAEEELAAAAFLAANRALSVAEKEMQRASSVLNAISTRRKAAEIEQKALRAMF
jgi:hypothetical protein